jgi:hypothetical protein
MRPCVADATARAIEQSVFARQHDHGNRLEHLVVLDQRAGLIAIEPRHHNVDKHDIRLMIGNLGQSVEAIHRGEYLAAFFSQQRLGGTTNSLTIVDHQDLEPGKPGLIAERGVLHWQPLKSVVPTGKKGSKNMSGRFNILIGGLPSASFV